MSSERFYFFQVKNWSVLSWFVTSRCLPKNLKSIWVPALSIHIFARTSFSSKRNWTPPTTKLLRQIRALLWKVKKIERGFCEELLRIQILKKTNTCIGTFKRNDTKIIPKAYSLNLIFLEVRDLKSKNRYLKVQISIGGDIKSFSDIGVDENRRKRFSNSVAEFLTKHGFDGVDLDWKHTEHPAGHAPHKWEMSDLTKRLI